MSLLVVVFAAEQGWKGERVLRIGGGSGSRCGLGLERGGSRGWKGMIGFRVDTQSKSGVGLIWRVKLIREWMGS